MGAKPDFSDARHKLARAQEHIADLDSKIGKFLATDFYRLRFEVEEPTGRLSVVFEPMKQPDKSINAAIGDAIGNLRSVLDYAVIALVQPITGQSEGIGFPNADNESGFAGQVRGMNCLGRCEASIHDHFIKNVQAYESGSGKSLWVLNKLRNIDKHRFLISAVHMAGVTIEFVDQSMNQITLTGYTATGKNSCLLQMPMQNLKFKNDPRPTFHVAINELRYVSETPAGPFLKSLAADVKSFIDALEIVV